MASASSANPPPIRLMSSKSNFQFEIDYSKSKDLPIAEFISSPKFTADGYDWALNYYPQGSQPENYGSHASLFLVLKSEATDIVANFSFKLLEKKRKFVTIYRSVDHLPFLGGTVFAGYGYYWGTENFIGRDKIEGLYCFGDILVISCNISVRTEPGVVKNYPGGLCEHVAKFWENRERFDVTFEVEGEKISAHRFMLALRSPVFEAKLFSLMAETKMEHIKINEMNAEVFKALLRFIYMDELPVYQSTNVERDDEPLSVELLQELFVVADRYALDKLTLLCEEQLERNLSVDMVATTLILADRHSRTSLKEKCLEFASAQENFSRVALTDGYLQIMQCSPTLFAELSEKVKASAPFTNKFTGKRKLYFDVLEFW